MRLKALVIGSEVLATVDTAPLNLERHKQQFASTPIGYLVDEFKKSYLRPEATAALADKTAVPALVGKSTFHTRFTLKFSAEELARTQTRLETFKNLRNRIVHHLFECQTLDFE